MYLGILAAWLEISSCLLDSYSEGSWSWSRSESYSWGGVFALAGGGAAFFAAVAGFGFGGLGAVAEALLKRLWGSPEVKMVAR